MRNKVFNFYSAIMEIIQYSDTERYVDTGLGYKIHFKDLNEWGGEDYCNYGFEVIDSKFDTVMTARLGDYCENNPLYLICFSRQTLKDMAEDMAVKCGVVTPRDIDFPF